MDRGVKDFLGLDDLSTWIDAYHRDRDLRVKHPYVGDLIKVLIGFAKGRPRRRVIEILERERTETGLSIPLKFEEAVQACFNRHSADSSVFRSKKLLNEEPLFYSIGGKGSGTWAVNEIDALDWLKQNLSDANKTIS